MTKSMDKNEEFNWRVLNQRNKLSLCQQKVFLLKNTTVKKNFANPAAADTINEEE